MFPSEGKIMKMIALVGTKPTKELLKFGRPELNFTYNINDNKGLKLLTRFK